jgi:8-oxo-dGTP diphosphatase
MASYTCIAIIDQKKQKVLFCKRVKPPFANLLNFVGGKIDANETPLVSAYRELVEETGITKNDIVLKPLVNFQFIEQKTQLYIYYGVLNKPVKLVVEFQKLI